MKEKCSNIREVDEEKDNESSLLPSHISNNSVKNYTQFTNHYSNYDKTTKNYIIAALLAIFLGFLGAHKFYMGKTIIGIIYILFSWTMIPTILGIFEGFRFLIEGQEKFLSRMSD